MRSRHFFSLLAVALVAAACGSTTAGTTTSAVPATTAPETSPTTIETTTTLAPDTTEPPGATVPWEAIDAAMWLAHGPTGLVTSDGTLVWQTDPLLGADNLVRDGAGGFVWTDSAGLWWLKRDAAAPELILAGTQDILLASVIPTESGPVLRSGYTDPTYRDLATGEEVDPPDSEKIQFDETGNAVWTAANGLTVEVTAPDVLLDAEGQPAEIREPAHLIVGRNGETVFDTVIGSATEEYPRLHDFDGRHLVISRGPFEPALPDETFFVIDLACAECVTTFSAAATFAVLTGPDTDWTGDVAAPELRLLMASQLVTDQGVTSLPDGLYMGFVDPATASEDSLSIDLAVWFSGEPANAAASEDGVSEIPVPNDFYIRNLDATRIVLPLSDQVAVTSVWFGYDTDQSLESEPISYDDFLTAMQSGTDSVLANLQFDPWWFTLRDGVIVALNEQYMP